MRTRLVGVAAIASLVVCAAGATVASASGPVAAVQGGGGILGPDGTRYTAVADGSLGTVLVGTSSKDGRVRNSVALAGGNWGVPQISGYGTTGGLGRDGRTLVLADTDFGQPLKARSSFALVDVKRYRLLQEIRLRGDFAFDALSPSGRFLYLIQHTDRNDTSHYVVRAYDRRRLRLLPGRIADRTQRSWVMQGFPVARVTGEGGRWVYTLYQNPGGYPFVHALDTVAMKAHCVGVPWQPKDQSALASMKLALGRGGRSLALNRADGSRYVTVDTSTWRVSIAKAGFPWSMLGIGLGTAFALVATALLVRLRRLPRLRRPLRQMRSRGAW
jgi:hypothetical protein